jgi:Putative transposase
VSFCKHYGHGNDAVLSYLSRYIFPTAISNARTLGIDRSHVTFRWKDRSANSWRGALSGCRALNSSVTSFSTSCRDDLSYCQMLCIGFDSGGVIYLDSVDEFGC